jgi:signal transduction histidine kinase/ligand-binding sensor domain-containing protein
MRSDRTVAGAIALLFGAILLSASCGASSSPVAPQPSLTAPAVELAPVWQHPDGFPPPDPRFDRISTEDGLPQSSVRRILQDTQGYMWFCTSEGLAKYDGYSFTVYKHDSKDPSSLQENRVEAVYEDRSDTIWAGTAGGWLERFDRDAGQFTHYRMPSTVRVLHEDAQGTFWIGVDDPGLLRFDRATGEASVAWRVGGVRSLFEDRDGVLWVGSQDGLLARYDRESDQFVPYEAGHLVRSIAQNTAGRMWVGTVGGGLGRLDPESGEFAFYRHDPDDPASLGSDYVVALLVDATGVLWIGAYRSGLNRLDPGSERFVLYESSPADPHSLSDSLILDLFQDRSGVLWVGTELGGISKLSTAGRHVSHFRHLPGDSNSLGSNTVTSMLQDDRGLLWIGTRYGLSRLDRASGQWHHYRSGPTDPAGLEGNYVSVLYEDQVGTLWIGTATAINRYDRETDQFTHYPVPQVYGLVQDREGALWVTAADGLYQYDRAQDRFDLREPTPLGEHSYWAMGIHEGPAGRLWMGTAQEGLARYDPATGEWRFYQHDPDDPQSVGHSFVEAIYQDPLGVMWLGTHRGLDRFDPQTETFTHYGASDGLMSDTVLGILPDEDGNLWISTKRGIARFDPSVETFRNYDAGDGLQGGDFSRGAFHRSASGEMFFGGNNGVNAFYPEQFTDNPHPPPVVITALSIFNQVVRTEVASGEQINLAYRENFLSFDFAALDYNNPEKNEYAYWMEGVDQGWVYAGTRRHADYPNLRPGDYVFWVKGSNNDGIWNEEGTSVRITIRPPLWGTWWFRGVAILALVGGAFAAYRLRVRGVEARSRELERQVEERTAELEHEIESRLQIEESLRQSEREQAVTAERNRLARELHDSVTQSLYAVTLYADATARLLSSHQPDDAGQNVQKLRRTARDALGEMRLLIYELRPPILEEEGLVAALETRLEAVEGRAGLQTALQVEGEGRLPPEVEQGLYRIASEALNNALKHARAQTITVSLHMEPQGTALEVVDDGIGFEPAAVRERGGMGLRGMEERAAEMDARLEIVSAPGRGTRVRVTWRGDEADH